MATQQLAPAQRQETKTLKPVSEEPGWFSNPITLGVAIGVVVYFVWVGPYHLYVSQYETLSESVSWLTDLLGPKPWLGRIMSSWVNLFTVVAFTVAVFLLRDRRKHLNAEESAHALHLLGDDENALILAEDALECRKRVGLLNKQQRDLKLVRLLATGLQRARANWSAEDVGQAVKSQSELMQDETDASFSLIRYLAWAIPSIGFIGTVLGIGAALYYFGVPGANPNEIIVPASEHLYTAFDTTLVALILSVILMFMLHRTQAAEEMFLIRATDWCMQRFVLRMHIPKRD